MFRLALPADLPAALRPSVVAALAAWLLFLAVLGLTHTIHVPISDKAQHFVGFGVLAVLLFSAFRPTAPRTFVWRTTGALTLLACLLSEPLQALLTTRPFDWADVAANVLGAASFLFVAWMADRWIVQRIVARRRRRRMSEARYWGVRTLEEAEEGYDDGHDGVFASADEMDVELDDILVDTPPLSAARTSAR
ncbi:hypothetical protein GGI15_003154 [Coemansia interrupta]|uniref:VanZ like family protein n=1 Tax=Coemansia interrupta TaxID=1126814 RepID=A0A9W8LJF6_9FUNG|nr:hypothetical protein GGI15_003154 [Coemansia interrupta]